jgi:hypothetical protein
MKQLITRLVTWLVQALVGIALFGAFAVFMLDTLAGCGQTYIDSKGAVRPVAKNSECIFIKHHGKE